MKKATASRRDEVGLTDVPYGPDEPLCVAERVQTTGFSVTKTRKFFVKKKKSGMIEDQISTWWGTKWTKMAKDAAETEEHFAGIRTIFFGIRTRKNGADQAIMTHRRIKEVGVWA